MFTDAPGNETRLFPCVSNSLYDDAPGLRAAVRPSRLRDAFSIRTPDASQHFGRIVTAHASAFDAERAGKWDRADFYWSELWTLLAGAPDDHPCWAAGATAVAHQGLARSAFRRHFVREVVVDSHAAFFRSQVEGGLAPLERPRIHLDGISRAHRALPVTDIEGEALLSNALASVALGYQDAAETAVEDVLLMFAEYFPKQTQYIRAGLGSFHRRITAQLERSKGIAKRVVIDTAIQRVSDLRLKFPLELGCYAVLAILHHEQTIALAEDGDVSGALLACRKAEAFGADAAVVTDTWRQLTEIMAEIQNQAAQLKEALRNTAGELTDNGRQLVAQASAGARAADRWSASVEAKEIRSSMERAHAMPVRVSAAGDIPLPSIALQSTTKSKSEERLGDMLAGKNSGRLRLQIVAAVLLVAFATGSTAREAWVARQHAHALEKVRQAQAAHDEVATLHALGELFGAAAPRGDQQRAVLAPLYRETLARWLTTKTAGLSPADRRVVERYKEQVIERGLDSAEVQP